MSDDAVNNTRKQRGRRFTPGVSGNPRGRTAGTSSVSPTTPQRTMVASQPIQPVQQIAPLQPVQQIASRRVPQSDDVLTLADNRPRVAKFSIKTSSENGGFLVKLMYKGSKKSYMTIFVNAGSYYETKVALGEYDAFYATGDRWIGFQKFWSKTRRRRLLSTFSFTATETATEYETQTDTVGHYIELIKQRNGNIEEEPISESEFGE